VEKLNVRSDEEGCRISGSEMVREEEGVEYVETVEVEAYGKRNEKPPRAKHYVVRIDTQKYTFDKQIVTGRELLEKAGKMPFDKWRIYQKLHGGQMIEIGYDRKIDLGAQGVERFTTFEISVTDGEDIE
jgi:hypothetical protein